LLKTTSIGLSIQLRSSAVRLAGRQDRLLLRCAGEAYSDETNTLQQKYFDYYRDRPHRRPILIASYTQEFQQSDDGG